MSTFPLYLSLPIYLPLLHHPREMKGKFSIKGGSIQESDAKREFVFDVKCDGNEEILTLAASSAAEKSKWIMAIIAAAASVTASEQEYASDFPSPNGSQTQ